MRISNGTWGARAVALVGAVYAYTSATLSGGVPQTADAIKAVILAGQQTTEKCATSISSVDYWVITDYVAAMPRAQGTSSGADIDIEVRELAGVFRPVGLEIALERSNHPVEIGQFATPLIIPSNADVRMVMTATASNTAVQAHINGFLMTQVV